MSVDADESGGTRQPVEDRDLWEFLRGIESDYAVNWHPESPRRQRLRLLQDRYDPSGATS